MRAEVAKREIKMDVKPTALLCPKKIKRGCWCAGPSPAAGAGAAEVGDVSAERWVPSLLRPPHPSALGHGHRPRWREPRGLCAAEVLRQHRNFSLQFPKFPKFLSREEEAGEEQLLGGGRVGWLRQISCFVAR